ncbi:MAG TPA: hypothetical protein VK461_01870, partial [Acidimicrobiales bacterium]|nr:hypothetical protein [Acidimicrobiales bacterium]
MIGERFVVLGLGQARSAWFSDLARMATGGSIPIELVKCVSHEEARVRLTSGRPFSALLVDAGLPGVDRDLLDTARRGGVEVLVVDDGRATRDWEALGASGTLPADFGAAALLAALTELARPIMRGAAVEATADVAIPRPWSGELVAVTGARGGGASTVAGALAQGLATSQGRAGSVLLADLALDADQGVLHHAPDVVPGFPELVEAHRSGVLSTAAVQSMVFDVEERGYHLLLGMRRRRGWAALRPRALDAAIDSLLGAYPVVVADIDPDLDGHHECGSFDIEERNTVARLATERARAIVCVGAATLGGLHGLAGVLRDLLERGCDASQLVTVVNRAPRSPRERAGIARVLAQDGLASPVFVP